MKLHLNVKDRDINNTRYFHVRVKSVIYGKKIESQRYYFYNLRNPGSYEAALEKANNKALHLCHRHDQMRRARDSRVSYADMLFRGGLPKGIYVCKAQKEGRSNYFSIKIQTPNGSGGQYKRERTFDIHDIHLEESHFKHVFEQQFSHLCLQLKLRIENEHIRLLKLVVFNALKARAIILIQAPDAKKKAKRKPRSKK